MMQELFDELGYKFQNDSLLYRALTHKSASSDNNERLEFLGDAVLNLYVSEKLFNSYPSINEGKLSLFKSNIVSRENLNLVAKKINLHQHVVIGKGEKLQGNSILGNSLEALIAAIFLDSDYECTLKVLDTLFKKDFLELEEDTELKDPKSSLQEYIQKKYKSLPHYRTKESAGPDGNVRFHALCTVDEASLSCEGSGRTRKRAELDASNNMLEILDNYDSTA